MWRTRTITGSRSSLQQAHFERDGAHTEQANGQFNQPRGVAADSSGNVYVSIPITTGSRGSSAGKFSKKWGTAGYEDGHFYDPYGWP